MPVRCRLLISHWRQMKFTSLPSSSISSSEFYVDNVCASSSVLSVKKMKINSHFAVSSFCLSIETSEQKGEPFGGEEIISIPPVLHIKCHSKRLLVDRTSSSDISRRRINFIDRSTWSCQFHVERRHVSFLSLWGNFCRRNGNANGVLYAHIVWRAEGQRNFFPINQN